MAGAANNPNLLTRCLQGVEDGFFWMMWKPFFKSLTHLCRKDVLLMTSAIILAAIFALAFEPVQALPQNLKQLLLIMIPSLILVYIVYTNSPTSSLLMRWPSPIRHRELNGLTMLSLLLLTVTLSVAYKESLSCFPWTLYLALALTNRLYGLCSWLGRVYHHDSALEFFTSVLLCWCLALPIEVVGLGVLQTLIVNSAVVVGLVWWACVSFWSAVIAFLLAALLAVNACWANDNPGLDSVAGLYGSLLLILAHVLTVLQDGSMWPWVAMAHYCAQTVIAVSTSYATAYIP